MSIMQGEMTEIPNIILALSKKYNTNEVDFFGIKNYAEGIAKKTQELEKTRYNKNTLKFNYHYKTGKEILWQSF